MRAVLAVAAPQKNIGIHKNSAIFNLKIYNFAIKTANFSANFLTANRENSQFFSAISSHLEN